VKELFFQLQKLDPFEGIATGICATEELDHDGEILDYLGSKPYFQKWSDSQVKASKGKSKGNIRLQHDEKRPVGRLLDIQFDDAAKAVTITAKIEEPVARNLLATGVLTGFSIGGEYLRRTPTTSGAIKYIAGPSEISVCDRPCSPSAVYSVVKGDGSQELRKFAKPGRTQESELAKFCKSVKRQGWPDSMICAARGITYGTLDKVLGRPAARKMARVAMDDKLERHKATRLLNDLGIA